MIPRDFILAWQKNAPWPLSEQVEQDLLISRALVELFSKEEISKTLAFRGGTALYKLYLTPASRYSEDIDLVQITGEPIGDVLTSIREILDPLLGEPKRKFGRGRVTISYRYDAEGMHPTKMRLKIEINTREHFSVRGFIMKPFQIKSPWFEGEALVPTYHLEELMGTKLRALFQRNKGRDLFDLWYALKNATLSTESIVDIFYHYLEKEDLHISRAQFEENLDNKLQSPKFQDDIIPLLSDEHREGWDVSEAAGVMRDQIFPYLQGDPWKGA